MLFDKVLLLWNSVANDKDESNITVIIQIIEKLKIKLFLENIKIRKITHLYNKYYNNIRILLKK